MFKTMTTTTMAAIAALSLAGAPALAQQFSPPGNTTLSGLLELEQSQVISCQVEVNVTIDANGNAAVTGRSFSPGTPILCGGVVQPTGTWSVTPTSTTNVRVEAGATSILGTCFGEVDATWSNATSSLTFNNAIIPGNPDSCRIDGTLTASPIDGTPVTIVP